QQGAQVARGRCYEGEGAPAFWPWVQVLRSCVRQLDANALAELLEDEGADIAPVVPAVRERLPQLLTRLSSDSPQARFAMFDRITRLIARVARQTPLIIIVADLPRADPSSLLFLQ